MSNFVDLGRRAVASGHWRWMPGVVDQHGRRVIGVHIDDDGGKWLHYASPAGGGWLSLDQWLCGVGSVEAAPDFDDAATLGCLLALVREAWGDPMVCALAMSSGRWCVSGDVLRKEPPSWQWGATEAEALVAALEAAP